MPHITILDADSGDWSGLYVDGKLSFEGHSIDERQLLQLLQRMGLLTYESKEATTEDNFPENLADAVLT